MLDIDKLCGKCFNELNDGNICNNCGFDNSHLKREPIYLPYKDVLKDKYLVGAVQGRDSDSVTYLGYDLEQNKQILIREFLPKGIANRLEDNKLVHVRQKFINEYTSYEKAFVKLWSVMLELQNLSASVPCYDVFEENSTDYAILEKIDGVELREYLLRVPNGYVNWENARVMFMPVLTTIEALHSKGIVHGSITPENLLLCADGKVRLKPFCITQAYDAKTPIEFLPNDGYTALEQYDNNQRISRATDIYSFSACIYRALVGANPPDAISREANDKLMIPNDIAEGIPPYVIKAMGAGLQVHPERRIQCVNDLRELLEASPSVQSANAPVDNEDITKAAAEYIPSKTDTNKKSKGIIIALVLIIIIAIGVGVYLVNFSGMFEEQTTAPVVQTEQYEVPDFVSAGYNQKEIENNGVWVEKFRIKFDPQYSKDVEEGIVFAQSVQAGTKVDAKTEIILSVSKGIQTEQIPNVGGMNSDAAIKVLEDKGFKAQTEFLYNDGTHVANTVKSAYGVSPMEGTQAAVGSIVVLQIYGESTSDTDPTKPTQSAGTVKENTTESASQSN